MTLPLIPVFGSDGNSDEFACERDGRRAGTGAPSSIPTERMPTLAVAAGLGLAFFALAWLGILMTREFGRIAAVWLANGIAVAVVLRSPRASLPWLLGAVGLGNLAANLAIGDPLDRALLLTAANLVEIGIVVALVRPAFHPDSPFDQGAIIGRFMGAALVGSTLAALLAAILLRASEGADVVATATHWATADLLGLLIVVPLLLSIPHDRHWWSRPRSGLPRARLLEEWLLVSVLIGAMVILFGQDQAALLFVVGPLLVLCAFRLRLAISSLAILASAGVAVAMTWYGHGPIARLPDGSVSQIHALQALIASMIALVLPVHGLIVERDRLGTAFAASERKFLRIAEASSAGILHLDLQGRVTWSNRRWLELTGSTDDCHWMEAVADTDRRALATLWTEARATLEPVEAEFTASRAAQATSDCRWVTVSIHPERESDGSLTGFVVRLEDITARRLSEDALCESERLYRLVTENVDDIVIRISLEGRMTYVSSAAHRILGFDEEELCHRPLRDLVHGEDWAAVAAVLDDPVALASSPPEVRYRHRCADGNFRWVEAKFRPIFDLSTGEPVELVASIRDISRRYRTEQIIAESAAKLRESHRLISLAEDLAKVGHWRLDLDQSDFDYSLQVNAILGVARRETLTVRRTLRLVKPEDRSTLLSTVARARRAERPCECEVRLTTPAGDAREVRVVIQADRDRGGRLHGIFGVVRDVTIENRAKAELVRARDKAHEAARAKAHFLATMSHEIRTPMTGVMGMIDLLLKDPDREDRVRYLDMLRTSADLLMAVLDDILDFSRIDSGQLRLERRDYRLDHFVEETVLLFERQASAKGLRLRLEQGGDAIHVRGDPLRLRQVLANLLSNAIKFTEAGEIVVRLQANVGEEATAIRLEVEDEGIGIAPGTEDQLFEPFVQADVTTSRRYGGTGLGLAICRRLIDAMGGSLVLDRSRGSGATFRVDLSLPNGDPKALATAIGGERDSGKSGPRMRSLSILVAEDNPVNQMLLGAMLRAEGHRVTAVENGRLAVDAAAGTAYDAIIMDMQMPEMDGLAATRAIRASGGPCAAVPILALTADASPERRRFYDGAGLSAFLTKPIDQDLLFDHLRSIAALETIVDVRDAEHEGEPGKEREPLFDDSQLAALRAAVGDARIEQMFDLLDLELAQRPSEILQAVRAGDLDGARRIAHSLKGASGSAGALAVASCAARLECEGMTVDQALTLVETAERTRKAIAALSDRSRDRAASA